MMPPNVAFVVPPDGGVAVDGAIEVHGHSLHILDDDALELTEQQSAEVLRCPVRMETFDEGDLMSEEPGSFQVRCVMTVDVSALPPGPYVLKLNLLSGIFTSTFKVERGSEFNAGACIDIGR